MLAKLKKLMFPSKRKKIVIDIGLNEDIVERINKIVTISDLLNKICTPHGKLYLLNVYYLSFNHLAQNLINDKVTIRDISAVNVYSYFKDCYDLNDGLVKISAFIARSNLNSKVVHDLIELLDSIEYLIKTEEGD